VHFHINKLPDKHIVDRYMETLSVFGIENDNEGLDYFVQEKDRVDVKKLLGVESGKYVAFVIGAAHNTKKYPVEKVMNVCRILMRYEVPVVLIGGENDRKSGNEIVRNTGRNSLSTDDFTVEKFKVNIDQKTSISLNIKSKMPAIINACGDFTINQSASIIQQAKVVITNDTGMMHIASAFNKPVVSIWGNTVPAFGMYPYQPKNPENVVIIENTTDDLFCRPCSKIGFENCPRKHFKCMLWDNELRIADKTLQFFHQ
jgi:ADP-heptose:LPS heptosyltransferase